MKKLLSLLIILLLTLNACASKSTESPPPANTEASAEDDESELRSDETEPSSEESEPESEDLLKIKEAGSLKVGVSYLNPETGESLETDIAHFIAAEIFRVTVPTAIKQSLCQFQTVTDETASELLINGELDVVVGVLNISGENQEALGFSATYLEDEAQEYSVATAKDNSGLTELTNRVVTHLIDSGEMADLFEFWDIEVTPAP